jgi:hypothetical protein
MKDSAIHLEWREASVRQFRTGVSLHSHTLYSQETLDFIYRLARSVSQIRWVLSQGETRYRALRGYSLDLTRAWWTPPCAPYAAWMVERSQIEQRLQLNALVSLTDHDNIDASLSLRAMESCREIPVSVEWTVPHAGTFLHVGVHNLPADDARQIFAQLAGFTAAPDESHLMWILQSLSKNPEILIVLNHPCWDEKGIGTEKHVELAAHFVTLHREWIHALELNGLRPWRENRQVMQMGRDLGKPVVSGGDRHALEPNVILDLTNATTFAEYVEQVRSGWTHILVTNQYREPYVLRILQSLEEILQDYADHGRGWRRWSDRVFYRCDDGVTRSLTELFPGGMPGPIQVFVKGVALIRQCGVRRKFRSMLPREHEFAL